MSETGTPRDTSRVNPSPYRIFKGALCSNLPKSSGACKPSLPEYHPLSSSQPWRRNCPSQTTRAADSKEAWKPWKVFRDQSGRCSSGRLFEVPSPVKDMHLCVKIFLVKSEFTCLQLRRAQRWDCHSHTPPYSLEQVKIWESRWVWFCRVLGFYATHYNIRRAI